MKAVITAHAAKNAQRFLKIILPSALQTIFKKDGKDTKLTAAVYGIDEGFTEIFSCFMRYMVLFRKFALR